MSADPSNPAPTTPAGVSTYSAERRMSADPAPITPANVSAYSAERRMSADPAPTTPASVSAYSAERRMSADPAPTTAGSPLPPPRWQLRMSSSVRNIARAVAMPRPRHG